MLDLSPARLAAPLAVPLRSGVAAASMAAADLIGVEIVVGFSFLIRWLGADLFDNAPIIFAELAVFVGVATVLIHAALGLYPGYGLSAPERFRRRLVGIALAFSLAAGWDYMLQHGIWSRVVILMACGLSMLLLPALNDLTRALLQRRGRWGVPVVVHAMDERADDLIRHLRKRRDLGFEPVACLSDDPAQWDRTIAGLPVIGPAGRAVEQLPGVRHAFVYLPHLPPDQWATVVNRLRFPCVYLVPSLTGHRSLSVRTTDLGGTLSLSMADNLLNRRKLLVKQVLDICLTVPLVLSFLPLFTVLYLAVRLSSRGPAIFRQARVGRHGRVYHIYKFRTMVVGAEAMLADYLAREPEAAAQYQLYKKLPDDPRVTPMGRFLRQYSLDELPQLLNVLKGDMSLVGPRCYMPHEIQEMGNSADIVHAVKPGITGYWQVSGRNRNTFAQRVEMDVYYIRNWSVSFDLFILYETARVVLTGRDAH